MTDCEWRPRIDAAVWRERWLTDCGHELSGEDPEQQDWRWCPWCGNWIEVVTDDREGRERGE